MREFKVIEFGTNRKGISNLYWWSIVILAISRMVLELRQLIGQKVLLGISFNASLGVIHCEDADKPYIATNGPVNTASSYIHSF